MSADRRDPETGRSLVQDQRLVAMGIRRGWWRGSRWATDATLREIEERSGSEWVTVKDKAMAAVVAGLACEDHRVKQRAVANLIAMENQNQDDSPAPQDVNLNVGGDLLDALNAVGGMTPEQRAKLAEADRILDEAGRSEQASGQAPVPDLGGSHSVG